MNVQELYELFKRFLDNDFAHLKKKVDWLFAIHVAALLTLVANLVLFITRGK